MFALPITFLFKWTPGPKKMVRVRVSTLWFHPLAPPPGRPDVVSDAARSPSMSTAPTTAVDQQTLDPLAVQPQVGGSPVWPSHQQPRWSPLEPQYPITSSTPSSLPTPTNAVPPVVSSMGAYLKLHTSRNIYKGLRDSGLLGRTPIVSDSLGARARGVRGAWGDLVHPARRAEGGDGSTAS